MAVGLGFAVFMSVISAVPPDFPPSIKAGLVSDTREQRSDGSVGALSTTSQAGATQGHQPWIFTYSHERTEWAPPCSQPHSPDYQRKTGKPHLLSTEDSGGRKDTTQALPPTKANPGKQSSALV